MRVSRRGLALLAATLFLVLLGLSVMPGARERLSEATEQLPLPDTIQGALQFGAFNVRAVEVDGRRYHYQVFVPRAFESKAKWPVIVSLHGSGNRGSDNRAQTTVAIGPTVRAQADSFPAVVIFPQNPAGVRGVAFTPVVMAMLDHVMREFHGDSSRVYLTGFSYGGGLGYDIVHRHPERFAAFVPVAAQLSIGWTTNNPSSPRDSVYAAVAARLRKVPMWVFQGATDENVPPDNVRAMVKALQDAGVNVRYDEYPDAGHNVAGRTYDRPELYAWMFAQHR